MTARWLVPAVVVLGLAACSSAPSRSKAPAGSGSGAVAGSSMQGRGGRPPHCPEGSPYAQAQEDPNTRGHYRAGGLYRPGVRDSTPDHVPDVDCIPEPLVRDEPRSAVGNKSPYVVLGKEYRVMGRVDNYVERGTASYYGAKFHGRLTSNREVYDMYQFTAAHKTLPLPSFARVTNLDNGESVVVRVNDRGPFHEGRVIDLSYAAAVRLGITQRGTGRVEVRGLTPAQDALLASRGERRAARGRSPDPSPAAPTAAAPTAAAAPPSRMDRLVEALPAAPAAAQVQAADAAAPTVTVQALPAETPATDTLGAVLLQVASFSSRENATRALGRLSSAGIHGGILSDVVAGGRTLWRLRVPADDLAMAAELAGRIAGLGLGSPQIVRD
ncbi:septal ring lytic transglycosylase RlpA family protein [Stenotrophomonas mori]|uniref:Endolytic peptidoglycan transglycosylase RlpA n=1 Tax=Stenotrophomonas mori TaxID=2871096 RepID=A0ABT0SJB2_9GAMM|nr:septal ring lytic transglycosylase RlpA family protein [Stenotrophomonas mori]MCL7715024.1 septal ring lytic transglycosylase RlpA family protein [Stenotrophomonas mori]